MALSIEEFKQFGADALTAASAPTEAGVDVGVISDKLSKMADAYVAAMAENAQLVTVNTDLTAKNESLRQTNMGLFLQVGSLDTGRKMGDDGVEKPRAETITVADLFNDKGELI